MFYGFSIEDKTSLSKNELKLWGKRFREKSAASKKKDWNWHKTFYYKMVRQNQSTKQLEKRRPRSTRELEKRRLRSTRELEKRRTRSIPVNLI